MFLRELWYFALPGDALKPGTMRYQQMLNEPLLIGRDSAGGVFALKDICPHRGIPLSYGRFDGLEVECCYHGWRFDPSGACTRIPSLTEEQRAGFPLQRIRVQRYPCREVQGNIWVFFGAEGNALPEIPQVPEVTAGELRMTEQAEFSADLDHAVMGLMDPAHGPFVHRSWWWRSGDSIHEKAKQFGPTELGFSMLPHRPSSNSSIYKLFGGVPETEIRFQLPGVRIEHVRTGRHVFCGLTAVTPVDADHTRIYQVMYWTIPWLTWFKPLLRPFARAFLNQDRSVVQRQREGLAWDPKLMLINDADVQARWYLRLKKEFRAAQTEQRAFNNPVKATTLRWRS